MASDPLANALETFSAPLEHVIAALGQGIAEAQKTLDLNSVAIQETIDADPVLSQYGLQAPWYQFPKVDLQLTISLTVAQDTSTDQPGGSPASAPLAAISSLKSIRLVAQPVSASFQSHFNYSGQAASQVNLSIVPIPAPRP